MRDLDQELRSYCTSVLEQLVPDEELAPEILKSIKKEPTMDIRWAMENTGGYGGYTHVIQQMGWQGRMG